MFLLYLAVCVKNIVSSIRYSVFILFWKNVFSEKPQHSNIQGLTTECSRFLCFVFVKRLEVRGIEWLNRKILPHFPQISPFSWGYLFWGHYWCYHWADIFSTTAYLTPSLHFTFERLRMATVYQGLYQK